MKRYVLRLDLELDTLGGEKMMGHLTNCLIKFAKDKLKPNHYRWAFTSASDGFQEPDLEKELNRAMLNYGDGRNHHQRG